MIFDKNITQTLERYRKLSNMMLEAKYDSFKNYEKISKEFFKLKPIIEKINIFSSILKEEKDLIEIITDQGIDLELKNIAEKELSIIKIKKKKLKSEIKISFLPQDEADGKSVILEVRAGTGGNEATLFARDLLRMYQRYSEIQGWKTELMNLNETCVGGVKEAILFIKGFNVFSRLKFESGVHRVQRVPATETNGRIHTSAATIAVLPEAEEVDIDIEEKDLRIDVYRSSGPGGQSVNTTDSAVRITHLPTGIVVQQQDEKSQHKNKNKALKILRSRVYDLKRIETDSKRAKDRKVQIGTGDRSERIRTYNFPQGRVTDHRINLTLYKLNEILNGEAVGEVINALMAKNQIDILANLNINE